MNSYDINSIINVNQYKNLRDKNIHQLLESLGYAIYDYNFDDGLDIIKEMVSLDMFKLYTYDSILLKIYKLYYEACGTEDSEIAIAIIDAMSDAGYNINNKVSINIMNLKWVEPNEINENFLSIACLLRKQEVINYIVEHIDFTPFNGSLYKIIDYQFEDIAIKTIEKFSNILILEDYLFFACIKKCPKLFIYLLNKGADIFYIVPDVEEDIFCKCVHCLPDIAIKLIDEGFLDICRSNLNLSYIISYGDDKVLLKLFSKGYFNIPGVKFSKEIRTQINIIKAKFAFQNLLKK